MDIRLISGDGEITAEFYVEGIPTHILNAIRRTILTEVPTLAIHDVIIYSNTSVLYDEELALRLALVPLKINREELDIIEHGKHLEYKSLKELVEMSARLKLKAKAEEDIITVTAESLEPIDRRTIRPVYPDIPIVKLGEGQEIDLEMVAKVGKGKDHAKWIPVSTLGYHPIAILRVNDECDGCEECIKACPKKVLKIREGKPILEGIGLYECDLCRICARSCPKSALKIEPSDTEFIFRIKSIGQHSVKEIILTAIDILSEKYDILLSRLEKAIKDRR